MIDIVIKCLYNVIIRVVICFVIILYIAVLIELILRICKYSNFPFDIYFFFTSKLFFVVYIFL